MRKMREWARGAVVTALVTLAIALLLGGLLSGCGDNGKRALVGHWVASSTAGKPGKLSDLTIAEDGTFLYAGQNAYGGTVRFAGTYELGSAKDGPWIKLVYHDFPNRPITWFYKRDGNSLAVSVAPNDLKTGTAMVFTKQ
jgi:hypothetical protein